MRLVLLAQILESPAAATSSAWPNVVLPPTISPSAPSSRGYACDGQSRTSQHAVRDPSLTAIGVLTPGPAAVRIVLKYIDAFTRNPRELRRIVSDAHFTHGAFDIDVACGYPPRSMWGRYEHEGGPLGVPLSDLNDIARSDHQRGAFWNLMIGSQHVPHSINLPTNAMAIEVAVHC